MDVSIVIPVRNAARHIRCQLEALATQVWSGTWEVIVADNGSTDETLEMVEQYRRRIPAIRAVDASQRSGAGYARNVGAQAGTGDIILFCDADDEMAPGWLAAMAEAVAKCSFVACWLDYKKLNPPWMDFIKNAQATGQLERMKLPPYVPVAGGCSLGIKRVIHEAVGGFDDMLRWQEDTDYCVRVQVAGYPLKIANDAVVYYRTRRTYLGIYKQSSTWARDMVAYAAKSRLDRHTATQSWRIYFDYWKRVVKVLPGSLLSHEHRAKLMWDLGWLLGTLRGVLADRIPPLLCKTLSR